MALSVNPPFESGPPAVSRHDTLWRPDFPPRRNRRGGCPSGRPDFIVVKRAADPAMDRAARGAGMAHDGLEEIKNVEDESCLLVVDHGAALKEPSS